MKQTKPFHWSVERRPSWCLLNVYCTSSCVRHCLYILVMGFVILAPKTAQLKLVLHTLLKHKKRGLASSVTCQGHAAVPLLTFDLNTALLTPKPVVHIFWETDSMSAETKGGALPQLQHCWWLRTSAALLKGSVVVPRTGSVCGISMGANGSENKGPPQYGPRGPEWPYPELITAMLSPNAQAK